MSASVSKQRLLDVLKIVRDGKPGFFKQWASRYAKLGVWHSNADAAQVLVNVYGGMATMQALAASGLERVYIDDLISVVGDKRARNILRLIDLKAGRIKKQPIRKFGLIAGRVGFALAAAVALWSTISDKVSESANTVGDAQAAEAAATSDAPVVETSSAEAPPRLPSCEMYAVFKTHLACTDHVTNRLAGQNIPTSAEARDAERKMFTAANSYPASAQCRDFAEQVVGLTLGRIDAATAEFSERSISHEDIVNACSETYGEVLREYCGSMPGGCASAIPKQ